MTWLGQPSFATLLATAVLAVVALLLAAAWVGQWVTTVRAARALARKSPPKPVLLPAAPTVTLFLFDADERKVLHQVKIDVRARKPVYHHQGVTYVASKACLGGYHYRRHV